MFEICSQLGAWRYSAAWLEMTALATSGSFTTRSFNLIGSSLRNEANLHSGVRGMPKNPFEPVRIGVVGLGRFGRLHALTVARLAEAELVGLVARRQASLDGLAAELPGIRGWTSLERAVEESEAEAWVIACSTAAHVP